jgi:hypothetical protein
MKVKHDETYYELHALAREYARNQNAETGEKLIILAVKTNKFEKFQHSSFYGWDNGKMYLVCMDWDREARKYFLTIKN